MKDADPAILSFADALRRKEAKAQPADDVEELSLAEDPEALVQIMYATVDAMKYLGILQEFAEQRLAGFRRGNVYTNTRVNHQTDSTEDLAMILRQGRDGGRWRTHPQFYGAINDILSARIRSGGNPGPRLATFE